MKRSSQHLKVQLKSPLQLDHYEVEQIEVKAYENFDVKRLEVDNLDPKIDIDYWIGQHKKDNAAFVVRLYIKVSSKEDKTATIPYGITVMLRGFFRFIEQIDEKTRSQLINLNGLAMVYSLARGIVGNITGQGPYSTYSLPTLNFHEVIKLKRRKNKQIKKRKASLKRLKD